MYLPSSALDHTIASVRRISRAPAHLVMTYQTPEGTGESRVLRALMYAALAAIGEPLREFQGVLRGVPSYIGHSAPLMEKA